MTKKLYTIKDLADQFGKSKQAIRNAIKKADLPVTNRKQTGKLTVLEYDEKTFNYLATKYHTEITGQSVATADQSDTGKVSGNELALTALTKQLDELNKQLQVKDDQIKELHTLLDQAQKLQLTHQQPELLADSSKTDKKGFFSRLFSRN